MSDRQKIRWMIAHYPQHLFQRTAEAFAQELEALLPGRFDVEIHTADSYVKQYNKLHNLSLRQAGITDLEDIWHGIGRSTVAPNEIYKKYDALWDGLRNGDIEITQAQVHTVGGFLDPTYHALDLPFLFKNHDHVSQVLDGEIGDRLGITLGEKNDIRGLAFTYSGGYRVFGSTNKITNLADLIDTKLLAGSFPSTSLLKELGHKKIMMGFGNDGQDTPDSGPSAVETTYIRFTGKHVYKTNHSIFLTTILTGNKFWDTLSAEEQDAFKVATKKVAKLERTWSVEDAKQYEQNAVDNGVTITPISDEDHQKLVHAAQKSYYRIKQLGVDPNLILSIIEKGKDAN